MSRPPPPPPLPGIQLTGALVSAELQKITSLDEKGLESKCHYICSLITNLLSIMRNKEQKTAYVDAAPKLGAGSTIHVLSHVENYLKMGEYRISFIVNFFCHTAGNLVLTLPVVRRRLLDLQVLVPGSADQNGIDPMEK